MIREQIILLQQAALAAEYLSVTLAMKESVTGTIRREDIEVPWAMLTEAIQNCYKSGAMKINELMP